ncbi:MAG: DUF937 domain-containing protein [Pseudomonadota bacterium]
MNLMELLSNAADGQGLDALARKHGATPEQAAAVAKSALPALSSGLKRSAASPDGLYQLAAMFRDNDAAEVASAPEANPKDAEAKGQAFMDKLFGEARPDIERELASDGARKSGLDSGTVGAMLPVIASMVLGMFQKSETEDSGGLGSMVNAVLQSGESGGDASAGGISGALGGLLGGAQASSSGGGIGGMLGGLLGGGQGASSEGLSPLMAMFDADGDGSVADDLLDRFMKR